MAKTEAVRYVCSMCGHSSPKWLGRCPSCGEWNSFTEEKTAPASRGGKNVSSSSQSLSSIPVENEFRFSSGISELDRVLGGGIVHGSSVLVGGEPGIGKSTLMLQVCHLCSARGLVLYVSGEESASQVRQRAERLGLDLERINILCETHLEAICHVIRTEKPQLVVIDSLQTIMSEEFSSVPGSVPQMRGSCLEINTVAKQNGCSVFFIGHVTKEGTIAGPKIIEHMVDTVLYFEESELDNRLIRASKNRFGAADEIGIFEMGQNGLTPIKDPSSFFISKRENNELSPGTAYATISEGSRTFVVEIQALVTDAKSSYTRVFSEKIDSQRIMRTAAILERHAGLRLSDRDIYINVAGGIRVNEVSVELAVAAAIYSAFTGKSLDGDAVWMGELSLSGEVRPVSYGERRLKAADDMGFKKAYLASSMAVALGDKTKINLFGCKKISDVLRQQGTRGAKITYEF
ncbi:MAG: DNA repair protein RadA [Sphaerochaetaceae bacterium]|nr:DNA repair protein RadA [Sphaerochaetaceae bacterium]